MAQSGQHRLVDMDLELYPQHHLRNRIAMVLDMVGHREHPARHHPHNKTVMVLDMVGDLEVLLLHRLYSRIATALDMMGRERPLQRRLWNTTRMDQELHLQRRL